MQPSEERDTLTRGEGRDPRWRAEYKVTQTKDKFRTVWTREEKTEVGYRVECQFLSASRLKLGDRYEEFVEFKYVSVLKKDLEKFEKAVESGGQG